MDQHEFDSLAADYHDSRDRDQLIEVAAMVAPAVISAWPGEMDVAAITCVHFAQKLIAAADQAIKAKR